MRKALLLSGVGALVIGATAAWQVQRESTEHRQAELLARATISEEQARLTALASVPGGKITEAEIEEENGRLIYSFDIQVAGQSSSFDVEVDANTGQLLQSEAEDDDDKDDHDDDDDRRAGGTR